MDGNVEVVAADPLGWEGDGGAIVDAMAALTGEKDLWKSPSSPVRALIAVVWPALLSKNVVHAFHGCKSSVCGTLTIAKSPGLYSLVYSDMLEAASTAFHSRC